MDELPPPFVEGDYIKSVEKNVVEEEESIIAAEPQTSAISSLTPNNTATVIAGREGHQQEGSNSWIEIFYLIYFIDRLTLDSKKAKKEKKKRKSVFHATVPYFVYL